MILWDIDGEADYLDDLIVLVWWLVDCGYFDEY